MPLEGKELTAAGLKAIKDPAARAEYDAALKEQKTLEKQIKHVADSTFGLKDVETDLAGWRVLEEKEPLERAGRLARDLSNHASPTLASLEVQAEVALLRGKVLQAVRALKTAHEAAPTDPRVALMRLKVLRAGEEALRAGEAAEPEAAAAGGGGDEGTDEGAVTVVARKMRPAALAALRAALADEGVSGGCAGATEAKAAMAVGSGAGAGDTLPWRLARARAALVCGEGAAAASAALVSTGGVLVPAGTSWEQAEEALLFLRGETGLDAAAASLQSAAAGVFPKADAFSAASASGTSTEAGAANPGME